MRAYDAHAAVPEAMLGSCGAVLAARPVFLTRVLCPRVACGLPYHDSVSFGRLIQLLQFKSPEAAARCVCTCACVCCSCSRLGGGGGQFFLTSVRARFFVHAPRVVGAALMSSLIHRWSWLRGAASTGSPLPRSLLVTQVCCSCCCACWWEGGEGCVILGVIAQATKDSAFLQYALRALMLSRVLRRA